jgi:hypothetical protein
MNVKEGEKREKTQDAATATRPARPQPSLAEYLEPREIFRAGCISVVVDGFIRTAALVAELGATPEGQRLGCSPRPVFFLSHFHSDHYQGLGPRWNYGSIFCTESTACLAAKSLGVPQSLFTPLKLDVPYRIDMVNGVLVPSGGVGPSPSPPPLGPTILQVTLIDANHCPGAAVFIFDLPDSTVVASPGGPKEEEVEELETNSFKASSTFARRRLVVHTGDFRFNGSSAVRIPWLSSLSKLRAKASAVSATLLGAGSSQRNTSSQRSSGGGNLPWLRHSPPKTLNPNLPPVEGEPIKPPSQYPLMGDNPNLLKYVGKIDELFLDNTFCDPKYLFPTQEESFALAINHVETAVLNGAKSLVVLVATYTIGKERIALALKEHFRTSTVWVSEWKWELLKGLAWEGKGFFLLPRGIYPSDPTVVATGVPAPFFTSVSVKDRIVDLAVVLVSPGILSYKGVMQAIAPAESSNAVSDAAEVAPVPDDEQDEGEPEPKAEGAPQDTGAAPADSTSVSTNANGGYTEIQSLFTLWEGVKLDVARIDKFIGIEGTGWVEGRSASQLTRRYLGSKVIVHSIPYSEHCSFRELVQFVAFLKPKKVVPTVSRAQYEAHEHIFAEHCRALQIRVSNVQPITRFFNPLLKCFARRARPREEDSVLEVDDEVSIITPAPADASLEGKQPIPSRLEVVARSLPRVPKPKSSSNSASSPTIPAECIDVSSQD